MGQSGLNHQDRNLKKLKRQACRLKAVAHAKEEALTETLRCKVGHRLRSIRVVRAGVADPTILARTLADCFRKVPTHETQHVSARSVFRIRNPSADIFKNLNGRRMEQNLQRLCAARDGRVSVCWSHVHVETLFRARAFAQNTLPLHTSGTILEDPESCSHPILQRLTVGLVFGTSSTL